MLPCTASVEAGQGMPSQRCVWTLYRVNPNDGFEGNHVHYGQKVRLGTSPVKLGGAELLLHCDTPGPGRTTCEKMGLHTSGDYHVTARPAAFGDPSRGDERSSWSSAFRIYDAADPVGCHGQRVDVSKAVVLASCATALRLHHVRCLKITGKTVKNAFGNELALEGAEAMRSRTVVYEPKEYTYRPG